MKIRDLTSDARDFTGNVWMIDGSEKILIDAGTGDSWNSIKQLNHVDQVVITHSHYDHTDNLGKIVEEFNPEVLAYRPANLDVKAQKVSDGDSIKLGGKNFQVIHTPGHRNDSICIYNSEEGIVFTGDLVFPEGGFGRTGLDQGDRKLLINSINKITDLDVKTFYPGHEQKVTENANKQINKSLKKAKNFEEKY